MNTNYKMSEKGSIEDNRVGNPSENTKKEIPEVRVLTQEAVSEQLNGFIPPHKSASFVECSRMFTN